MRRTQWRYLLLALSMQCPSLFQPASVYGAEFVLMPDPEDLTGTNGDFASIQAALDTAEDGDVITLLSGTYLVNLRFPRKSIMLRGEPGEERGARLDGSQCSRIEEGFQRCSVIVFDWSFDGGELVADFAPILEDLMIVGGRGSEYGEQPTDSAGYGGGLMVIEANPTLNRTSIVGNESRHYGGGISLIHSSPILDDCWIAWVYGCGVHRA